MALILPRMGKNTSGATLVEMLVAVAIMGIGLLPLVLALNKIYTNSYSLGARAEAQLMAAEKIDELRSLGFLTIETDSLAGNDSIVINEGSLSLKPYSRTTEIIYQKQTSDTIWTDVVVADTATNFIKIKSTVSWTTETTVMNRTITAMMTREGSLE